MKILVIAPHNDDEILGVGATMAKYAKIGHETIVCEVTAGDLNHPIVQQQKREAQKSHNLLGVSKTIFMDLPVVSLKQMPTKDINEAFLSIILNISPEIVFIPHKGDIHIDHRMTVEAAMVALRPVNLPKLKAIYAYETLSETEWNIPTYDNIFQPNIYNDVTEEIGIKLEAMKCHASQIRQYPHPRSLEAIEALARYRGSTVCCKYAEAFMVIRQVL